MMRLIGVLKITRVETLLSLVSNHVPSETEVRRAGEGGIASNLRAASTGHQSVRAQLGVGGGGV